MKINSDYKRELSIEIGKSDNADFDAFGLLSLIQGDTLQWAQLSIEQDASAEDNVLKFKYVCTRDDLLPIKAFLSSNADFDIKKVIGSFSEFVIKNETSHYLTDIEFIFTDGAEVYLIYAPFKLQKDASQNTELIRNFVEKLCLLADERLSQFEALTQLLDSGDCSLDGIKQALAKSGESTQSAEYDYDKTTLLYETSAYNTPNLLRLKTNEKIYITKRSFLVGKSRSHADYTIENNVAISRVHAQFNYEGDSYYVIDKGSTNKTFVNGYMISPNYPVKIFDGDQIKLADEIFVFSTN